MRLALLLVALGLVAAPSCAASLRVSRVEDDVQELEPAEEATEGDANEVSAGTGGNEPFVRDFPHDKNFVDAGERMVPSHGHMQKVAADQGQSKNVKLMLNQLDVLRNYLTKLSVRHEFLLEKYHAIVHGGEDQKLRRMVAEIVGDELKKREAQREQIVGQIVEKVVDILKNDLGINAEAADSADASDEDLQKEAVQEAVQEAINSKKEKDATQNEEQNAEDDAEGVGGTDRVVDDFNGEEGEEAAGEEAAGEEGEEAAGEEAAGEEAAGEEAAGEEAAGEEAAGEEAAGGAQTA